MMTLTGYHEKFIHMNLAQKTLLHLPYSILGRSPNHNNSVLPMRHQKLAATVEDL